MGSYTLIAACVLLSVAVSYAAQCGNGEFACRSGNQCIPLKELCDGKGDCHDRSDERKCDNNRCILRRGKKLRPFANGLEHVKVPCRYPALKRTRCGDWIINMTPSHKLFGGRRPKTYVVKSVWLAFERIRDGKKWQGRVNVPTAQNFIMGMNDAPVEKVLGDLEMRDVMRFSYADTGDQVTAYEKTGQWLVKFGLYEAGGTWHRRSGFEFVCLDERFEPSSIDAQMCGNGTNHEIATIKRERGWTSAHDDRQAVIFWKIMSDQGVKQTERRCRETQKIMNDRCNNDEERMHAARLCWKLTAKKRFIRCVMDNMEEPEDAMKHCVQFVCSGFTDRDACKKLADEIDRCQELNGVSIPVRKTCKAKLRIDN